MIFDCVEKYFVGTYEIEVIVLITYCKLMKIIIVLFISIRCSLYRNLQIVIDKWKNKNHNPTKKKKTIPKHKKEKVGRL